VKILNPLGEDTSVMRTTGLPSMLDILARNYAYHNKAAKLYELAKIYLPVEGEVLPYEPKLLMLGSYGEGDFFTLKGAVEALLRALNAQKAVFTAVKDNPSFHPGRCASLTVGGKFIGCLGQIHPLAARNYGMDCEVFAAELNFTDLLTVLAPEKKFTALPRFPSTTRDLAAVCAEAVTVGQLEDCISRAGGKLLKDVKLFDIYRGVGIQPGSKSVAFSLVFRAEDRTLTDADIEPAMGRILRALESECGAVRR
jgi:phenylalanyl-tRNA synthetase beta chain